VTTESILHPALDTKPIKAHIPLLSARHHDSSTIGVVRTYIETIAQWSLLVFLTDAKNLCFVEQTYKLAAHWLSKKMGAFVHGYYVLW